MRVKSFFENLSPYLTLCSLVYRSDYLSPVDIQETASFYTLQGIIDASSTQSYIFLPISIIENMHVHNALKIRVQHVSTEFAPSS